MVLVHEGTVRLLAGDPRRGREAFEEALRLNPGVARAHSVSRRMASACAAKLAQSLGRMGSGSPCTMGAESVNRPSRPESCVASTQNQGNRTAIAPTTSDASISIGHAMLPSRWKAPASGVVPNAKNGPSPAAGPLCY